MINLLPPKYKEELAREKVKRLIWILWSLFFLFFVFFAMLLLALRIYLGGLIVSQKIFIESERENTVKQKNAREQLFSLKETTRATASFYERQEGVASLLEELTLALPSESLLTSFSYIPSITRTLQGKTEKTRPKIQVAGRASTRESLLVLKERLEANPRLTNVFFPPSNWVAPANISFSLSFELKDK